MMKIESGEIKLGDIIKSFYPDNKIVLANNQIGFTKICKDDDKTIYAISNDVPNLSGLICYVDKIPELGEKLKIVAIAERHISARLVTDTEQEFCEWCGSRKSIGICSKCHKFPRINNNKINEV